MKNEVIIFEEQDIKLDVNVSEETVWLSQKQMAKLFQRNKSVISRHINSILENELEEKAVVAFFATTSKDKNILIDLIINLLN